MYTSIDRFRYARLKMNNFSRRGKRQWILCSLSVSWEFVFGWTSRKISIFPLTPPPLVFRNESNNSYTLFHISSPLHKIYVIVQYAAPCTCVSFPRTVLQYRKCQFFNIYPADRKLFTYYYRVWSGSCKKSDRKLSFYLNDY